MKYINPMIKRILIIGGGYVGLTLSAKLIKTPDTILTVLEADNERKKQLEERIFPVSEPGLDSILLAAIHDKRLIFSVSHESELYDAVFICVGTPPSITLEKLPENIFGLINLIKTNLKKNGLVFLRSTVTIGTTESFASTLEDVGRSDINTFFLPERTAEGVALIELDTLPQIIGPTKKSNIGLATEFLQGVGFSLIECSNSKTAEFVKLISNAWRDTVFGISNEIALMAEVLNLDAYDVINVANYKYQRANIPLPGPVGGPCLYKDSHILLRAFSSEFREQSIIFAARSTNEKVETLIYDKIVHHLNIHKSRSNVLFIGAAFKGSPKTNDIRNGLTSNLIRRLLNTYQQIELSIWDPTLNTQDLLDLSIFKINTLTNILPTIVILGNDSKEIFTEEIIHFLNKLSPESLIIDPWRVHKNIGNAKAKFYQLGAGIINNG